MTLDESRWLEKSNQALQEARILADAGSLPGAASRAYYGLYALVTARLLSLGLEPPVRHGNWPHDRIPSLVRQHFKTSFQKRTSMELVDGLYQMRLLADYGDHRGIEASDLGEAIRQLGAEVASRWRV